MSTLRIRFRFNHQSKSARTAAGGTKGFDNFSRVIVEEVAFTYSDHLYANLEKQIRGRLRTDIERELKHMARLFMTNVIGLQSKVRGPRGNLSAVSPTLPAAMIDALARAEAAHDKIDAHEDLCAERHAHIHTAIDGVKTSVSTVVKILAWVARPSLACSSF